MNIVTTADTKFTHCLKELAKSVRKYYAKPLIVYDLGLTEEDKKQIDAVIIPFKVDDEINYQGSAYLAPDGHENIRATHKPFCVRHYFENYNEPMILVDADCLFTERVELTGFDFGFTYAPPRKNKKVIYYNGRFNSGVMFFNTPVFDLIDKWQQECRRDNTTDQKAIFDVLDRSIDWKNYTLPQKWKNYSIKILDPAIYNDYHLTKKGKILHFITSKHQKDIFEKLMEGFYQGKDIRKMFRLIKRGKQSRLASLIDSIKNLFSG
ncbi:MAG: hypothetical protein JW912_06760 [Sedimentisphaerales bacterium]|nr:hypothetical protein [Sedimentisphaerales bacterium]